MTEGFKKKALKIIDKAAFSFFVILVFFFPISGALIEISFTGILFCFLLKLVFKHPDLNSFKAFFKDRINLSALVFFICIGLSLFASGPLLAKSLRAWISKWGEGVLLFYFARVFLDRKKVKQLLAVMVVSTFLVGINGLWQKITGIGFLRRFAMVRTDNFLGVRSSFNHFNNFATFLAVMFFIVNAFFLNLRKWQLKAGLILLSLLIVVNLCFTYSRGAWVAFICGCLCVVMFSASKKHKWIFLLVGVIFITGMFTVPVLRSRVLFSFQKSGDAGRFVMWNAAVAMFKESPLIGKGLGTFMLYLPAYTELGYQYAHNCYFQILAECGALGLLSFLWFLGEIIGRSYAKLKRNPDVLFVGLFAGLLTFLTHSFFDSQLYFLKLSIFFWLLASFIAVVLMPEKNIR
ncbi:MAG: O-antigen ligase family protein [Candidatus Omnitrophica bacterium]|nr:O-antigen ligase family protein [Candidatus Omnitrophota bacterium]